MSTDAAPVAGAGSLSVHDAEPQPSRPLPRPKRSRRLRRRDRERWAVGVAVLAMAAGGALADVSPSGSPVADRVLAAGAVALLAAAGSTAKRWAWLVTAGAALALADGWVAAACGALALGCALASTRTVRPPPVVGAVVGGFAGLALLHGTGPAIHGAPTLLAVAAAVPLLVSGYRYASRRARRRVRIGAAAVVAGVAVALAGYAAAAASAREPAERGLDLLRQGMDAARQGDDATATDRLAAAAAAFDEADRRLDAWHAAPARALPVIGHNVRAAGTMVDVAGDVTRYGTDLAVGVDVDSLTVQDGQLDLARVRALAEPLAGASRVLARADADLADVDAGWLVAPLADRLDEVRDELAAARPDVELAATGTRVVPEMFGADGPRRWLVAFVTPVEARGTGFMGNFAELTAVDGTVEMTRFGRAAELEQGGTPGADRTLDGPADYLARWERFAPASTWRNVTMSPDFPSVAQVMAQLYPQSGGQEVDGVIAVDPEGLAALLRITGPITAPGIDRELTADNAADFLLRGQYVELPDNPERIDALESLSRATFDRLTTGDLPGPGDVADALAGAVSEGRIHMWAADADQQGLVEEVGLDGTLGPDGTGDYLRVVSNNAAGNKVDLFLSRQVSYDAAWDPNTGEVTGTATVTLTNDAPSAGLPRYVIGNSVSPPLPAGTNRTLLSIYTPWEATGATLDGRPVLMERQLEGGYATYSLFLDVPPEGGARTVTLELAGRLPAGDRYRLAVGSQPLVNPDRFDLSLDVAGRDDVTFQGRRVPPDRAVAASVPLHMEDTAYAVAVGS